jgi:hypothetical protein
MLNITQAMDRRSQPSKRPSLNWKRTDWPRMIEDLAATDWSTVGTKPVEMWGFFRTRVSETVGRNVPVRAVRNRSRLAWLIQQIMTAVPRKQLLWGEGKEGKRCGRV